MSQGSLFPDTRGIVGRHSPDTSHVAADGVLPRTGTQRRKVYDLIVRASRTVMRGATDDEIQQILNMGGNTERPRRYELVAQGLVADYGLRRKVDGRLMIVWEAVVIDMPTGDRL